MCVCVLSWGHSHPPRVAESSEQSMSTITAIESNNSNAEATPQPSAYAISKRTRAARVSVGSLTIPARLIPGLRARYSRKGL